MVLVPVLLFPVYHTWSSYSNCAVCNVQRRPPPADLADRGILWRLANTSRYRSDCDFRPECTVHNACRRCRTSTWNTVALTTPVHSTNYNRNDDVPYTPLEATGSSQSFAASCCQSFRGNLSVSDSANFRGKGCQ